MSTSQPLLPEIFPIASFNALVNRLRGKEEEEIVRELDNQPHVYYFGILKHLFNPSLDLSDEHIETAKWMINHYKSVNIDVEFLKKLRADTKKFIVKKIKETKQEPKDVNKGDPCEGFSLAMEETEAERKKKATNFKLRLSLELLIDSCCQFEPIPNNPNNHTIKFDTTFIENQFGNLCNFLDLVVKVNDHKDLEELMNHKAFHFMYNELKCQRSYKIVCGLHMIFFTVYLTWSIYMYYYRNWSERKCTRDVIIDLEQGRIDNYCFGLYFTSKIWFNWVFYALVLMPIMACALREFVFFITGVKPFSFAGLTGLLIWFIMSFPNYFIMTNYPIDRFRKNVDLAIQILALWLGTLFFSRNSLSLVRLLVTIFVAVFLYCLAISIYLTEEFIKSFIGFNYYSLLSPLLLDHLIFFFCVFFLIDLAQLWKRFGVYFIAGDNVFKVGSFMAFVFEIVKGFSLLGDPKADLYSTLL